MSRIVFRPLVAWTDPVTAEPRNHNFTASWTDTMWKLCNEVDYLNGAGGRYATDVDVVLQVDAAEGNMRRDGGIRADAKVASPGVVVSFESKHGPLRYACDTYRQTYWRKMPGWQANVRAIVLTLKALRDVDRYGAASRGEQYTGWAQIGAGTPMPPAGRTMTVEDAARYVHSVIGHEYPTTTWSDLITEPQLARDLCRSALARNHPDHGGDPEIFTAINAARDVLTKHGGAA